METLSFLDKQVTLWLNSFYCSFADLFFYLSTSMLVWVPLFVVLICIIFLRQGGQGLVTLLVVAAVILVADQMSSHILKPLFERFRPSHDPIVQYLVHVVNDYRGGSYGFVSSHSANCFGVATFLALVIRSKSLNIAMFAWALINCYSRIYLGVHYVGDIVCGALLGAVIARLFYELYLHASLHFFVINHHNKWTLKQGLAAMFGRVEPFCASVVFWISVLMLVIISFFLTKHGITC
ncbi:MAG: phosphatase PAP2 family protein [Bacteroidales bacterium]|nr:phosphatase PAP2 family protein [Bacteroidales bacterium]